MAYEKTDAGRLAFKTADASLSSRERSLLIVVDGRRTLPQLLQVAKSLGGSQETIDNLAKRGLIREAGAPGASTTPAKPTAPTAEPVTPTDAGGAAPVRRFKGKLEKVQALRSYVARSAKQHLGFFKSGSFLSAVDGATDLADFQVLRRDLIDAVTTSKDAATAQAVAQGLDELLQAQVEDV
jgi:hypothetical protein